MVVLVLLSPPSAFCLVVLRVLWCLFGVFLCKVTEAVLSLLGVSNFRFVLLCDLVLVFVVVRLVYSE